jgi:hypothetical protein
MQIGAELAPAGDSVRVFVAGRMVDARGQPHLSMYEVRAPHAPEGFTQRR